MEEQLDCQYPHTWQLRERLECVSDRIIENLTITLEENSLLEVELPFYSLMTYVALAYEYHLSKNIEKGLEVLRDGEAKFRSLLRNENAQTLSSAFLHVMKATEAFLLNQKGDVEAASKVIIPKIREMCTSNRTAVRHGFPALFIGNFDVEGISTAINCLTKAIQENPAESIWYYMKADFIGELARAERVVVKMPSDEELQLLEKALEIKRTAIYTSYSAALYRQCSKELNRRILTNRFKNEPKIKELNEKSWKLYRESIELNPNCPETLFRCARGFLFLPYPFQDLQYAKELLDKAFMIAPKSRFGHHVMAEYYKIKKEPQKAMKHLKICEEKKLFGGTMALIRLEYQSGLKIDFIRRLENLLADYERNLDKAQILSEILTYYLLVLNEPRKACEYADRLMEFGKMGDFVLQCRPSGAFCTSGFMRETLYELLTNKLENVEDFSSEEQNFFDEFLRRLQSRKIATGEPQHKEETPLSACATSWRTKSYCNPVFNNSNNKSNTNNNWRSGSSRNSSSDLPDRSAQFWRETWRRKEGAEPLSMMRRNPKVNDTEVANQRITGAWNRNSRVNNVTDEFRKINVQDNTSGHSSGVDRLPRK